MTRSDQWFKAYDDGKVSSHVVGRFVDGETVDVKASEALGKNVYMTVSVLESKIVGSHDISTQWVREGFNKDELADRFPGAWEHYMASKGQASEAPALSTSGTPIEELEFIPRQKMAWLRELGFTTAEQIRDMSDTIIQGMGRDASSWRKKAKDYLAQGK